MNEHMVYNMVNWDFDLWDHTIFHWHNHLFSPGKLLRQLSHWHPYRWTSPTKQQWLTASWIFLCVKKNLQLVFLFWQSNIKQWWFKGKGHLPLVFRTVCWFESYIIVDIYHKTNLWKFHFEKVVEFLRYRQKSGAVISMQKDL